ncbi:MAG: gliding motility-associated C-terminal domain-containing protein [Bacteroidota bacterium]|uniref:Gliding motility-associated C-terminal domain-containing protein n=1 Tax=Flagellimonas profundi TaxID=2915620 RepID=A0ABS3FFX8_9FLAO|nr:gliding motility-associated C-terminal domain-containing protein [Allomuricauda profundi]MBO0342060.1 gliding motility-associated C-terminal domain-containing protein [Allomuricauda profundi]MEC7769966.1 gliding motility-associated C-terminal domain-containing protein [Bacteroidota bacterium]
MKRSNSTYSILVLALTLVLLGTFGAQAQVLYKPEPADNPNLAGNSAWTAVCASGGFNEYFVNFRWDPPMVESDNEFVLELSDADGYFAEPTELARVSDKNTVFDFEFQFALPTDMRGDNFKMRVRSTSPAKTSPASDAFSMYFIDYNSPLLISENGSGTIPSGGLIQLCGGGSVTLKPHNIPDAESYIYNWYRSGTLLATKSESITVSDPGMYYVELDYGDCSGSANTLSNTIEISTGTSSGLAINGATNVQVCPGETYALEANITGLGLTYTWYKDGTVVSGPTVDGSTYTVDGSTTGFEGSYAVEIDGAGVCKELSEAVTVTSSGSFDIAVNNEENIVLLPSQTKTLSVGTTANSPSYQWYNNGSPITDATSSSLVISEVGEYYVEVTDNGGACTPAPVASSTTTVVSPDSFEFVVDYVGTYTSCESVDATLSLSAINAVSENGAKTDVTADLQNSFNYQWKFNGGNVTGETSKTITISDQEGNGEYSLVGTVDAFQASSNNLQVKLASNETLQVTANGTVLCEGGEPIVLETTKDLTNESFQWKKDGTVVDSSSENFTVSETGVYQLVITTNECPMVSNEVTISDFDESLLVLDKTQDLIIVEGESQTLTASGADSYEWYDAGNNLISSSSYYDFTEEGEYLLIASFGTCTVSKVITVTYRDMFAIPNVITANGDGINDLWVLPNTYSRDPNVLVTIFNERGEQVFSQAGYENNWPQSTTSFNKQSMIFYYKITRGGKSLKQGTITVIK